MLNKNKIDDKTSKAGKKINDTRKVKKGHSTHKPAIGDWETDEAQETAHKKSGYSFRKA